jgi:bifunctional DNA-binding transcriptional regulator/antitoxin component of YhaV-PrlF toxin-antitoxin module
MPKQPVFISWSKVRSASEQLARVVCGWLPEILQQVRPWLSSEDLEPGTRWNAIISEQLEGTTLGIFCLTPESQTSPWMLFEAGAIAKSRQSRAYVYLFGMKKSELISPWNQFQSSESTKEDTRRLIHSLNKQLGPDTLAETLLDKVFIRGWDELESKLKAIREPDMPQLVPRSKKVLMPRQSSTFSTAPLSSEPETFRLEINSNQQITLPQPMLDALLLQQGDQLEILVQGKQIQSTRAVKVIPSHHFTPEIMALLRERENPSNGTLSASDLDAVLTKVAKGKTNVK